MKRIHLFEFEDLKWFPKLWRSSMTSVLLVQQKFMGIDDVLVRLLSETSTKISFERIVDLGSGSGGMLPKVVEELNRTSAEKTTLLLTDLYPTPEIIAQFEGEKNVAYAKESVSATNFKSVPSGLKTMINSFHHLKKADAEKVLKEAAANKQPILIYELADNKVPLVLWWSLLPLGLALLIIATLIITPFVRPVRFGQLFFTYLVPVIPLAYAWDGQASAIRIYGKKDWKLLVSGIESSGYKWEIGSAFDDEGKAKGIFVLGRPE